MWSNALFGLFLQIGFESKLPAQRRSCEIGGLSRETDCMWPQTCAGRVARKRPKLNYIVLIRCLVFASPRSLTGWPGIPIGACCTGDS
jgi:hypothetical protein